MISGGCNRSPQYNPMKPGAETGLLNQMPHGQYYYNQPGPMFLMAGSAMWRPMQNQMQNTRGYMMTANDRYLDQFHHPCQMKHNFGMSLRGIGHHMPTSQYTNFQQHIPNTYTMPPQPPPGFVRVPHPEPQKLLPIPTPSTGLLNGMKRIVNNFFPSLNCDLPIDRYKPKPRYNISEKLATFQPELRPPSPNLKMNLVPASAPNNIKSEPSRITDVVALFTSEDFPELPPLRKPRSAEPPIVEKVMQTNGKITQTKQKMPPGCLPPDIDVPMFTSSAPPICHQKSVSFEIEISNKPPQQRPVFGGRFKVVPYPSELDKSAPAQCHDDHDEELRSRLVSKDCILSSLPSCRVPRQRQISECSDDSFIVFSADGVETTCDLEDFDDDDDDLDDEDEEDEEQTDDIEQDDFNLSEIEFCCDYESDNDLFSDGVDVVDCCYVGRNKADQYKTASGPGQYPETADFSSGFDEKRVTFDPHPVVHVMHTWNFAYRAARKGPWEHFARDRARFQKRIDRASIYLDAILDQKHREKIYQSRFCKPDDREDQDKQAITLKDQERCCISYS